MSVSERSQATNGGAPEGPWSSSYQEEKQAANERVMKLAAARNGGPPPIPRQLASGSQGGFWSPSGPSRVPSAPRERFAGPAQGSGEDWPPGAPMRIPGATAVAVTRGDVGVKTSRGKDLDVHELLKREAFASPNDACDDHFEKNRPCPNDIYGISDQYVNLDSWVKDQSRSVPAQGIFSWNFMVQGVSRDQDVGVRDKVDTVVSIQLSSFMIPLLVPGTQMTNPFPAAGGGLVAGFPQLDMGAEVFPAGSSGNVLGYTFNELPYVGQITIELREIGLQAISLNGGVRYHFVADVIPVYAPQGTLSTQLGVAVGNVNPYPIALRVVPQPFHDQYNFTDPIQDIHGLTLAFRSFNIPLTFPLDTVIGAQAFTSSADYPYLMFSLPVGKDDWGPTIRWLQALAGQTRVFISGFRSGNAPIDNWVNQAPSLLTNLPPGAAAGITVDSVNVAESVPEQTIAIRLGPLIHVEPLVPSPPAAGEAVAIRSSTPVTIRFAMARMQIPVRFRRIVQRLTNYAIHASA